MTTTNTSGQAASEETSIEGKIRADVSPEDFGIPKEFADRAENYARWFAAPHPSAEPAPAVVGRAALTEFIEKFCLGKSELIATAESAFHWFNKCTAPAAPAVAAEAVRAAALEEAAVLCETLEIPFDIEVWRNTTKQGMTGKTALALAAAIRALAAQPAPAPLNGQQIPSDEQIELAALKHVAPGFAQLAAVSRMDPDYKKGEQFARLKAFVAELGIGAAPLNSVSEQDAKDAVRYFPHEFEVWQDDMPVASASGERDRALKEATHYAAQYVADGPVRIFEVTRTLVADAAMTATPSKQDEQQGGANV